MFLDLLGKLPQVLSASWKPCDWISLLPPTHIPPASLYSHPSRYHHETPSITSRPILESLRLHCVSPASCPASCIPHHPAFSCVLLRSPAFSCVLPHSPTSSCQSHPTLWLPTCCERLLALSNPCWTLPVGCSLVHRGRIKSTINLYPTKGKAMAMTAATTSLEWPD